MGYKVGDLVYVEESSYLRGFGVVNSVIRDDDCDSDSYILVSPFCHNLYFGEECPWFPDTDIIRPIKCKLLEILYGDVSLGR